MLAIDPSLSDFVFRYGDWLPAATAVLAAACAYCAVRHAGGKPFCGLLFWTLALLLCFSGRLFAIPTIAPVSDESEQMHTAMTVIRYADYFGHVFVGTHGPLITLPIVLLHLIGIEITYASVHVLATLIQFISGIILYALLIELHVGRLAQLVALPYFFFLAFALHPQLTTYNAELVALPFPLLALLLLVRYRNRRRFSYIVMAGVCLGLVPFLKIQFLPHAFVVGLVGVVLAWRQGERHWRTIGGFCASALLPTAALVVWAFFNPKIGAYYQRIYEFQAAYLANEAVGIWDKLRMFRFMLVAFMQNDAPTIMQGLLVPFVTGLLPVVAIVWRKARSRTFDREWDEAVVLLGLCFFSVYAVIAPGRAFPHYLLAAVPVLYLVYGYSLHQISKNCHLRYLAYFICISSLPLALASLSSEAVHALALTSETRVFSKTFLDTLARCARREGTVFVTNPYYGLYVAARGVSPLPGVGWLFDFDGKLTVPAQTFLGYMETSPPEVFVDVQREPDKGNLAAGFPQLAQFVAERYTPMFRENNAVIWCRRPEKLSFLDEITPCSVTVAGLSGLETNARKSYSYRWTIETEPTFTFPGDGRPVVITYRLLSPLFDNTLELVANGKIVATQQIPQSSRPEQAFSHSVTVNSVAGTNTLTLRLSTVNAGDAAVIPEEKRKLGLQVLSLDLHFDAPPAFDRQQDAGT